MSKEKLYKEFYSRLKEAIESDSHFEASWYLNVLIEDRLRSLLRSSGGEGRGGNTKPLRMMGPRLGELKERAKTDPLLKANFDHDPLKAWSKRRNDLIHAMADASMTIEQIDEAAKSLAIDGEKIFRDIAAACRRMKKHRDKVTA